jgi:hypothetical protein
VNKTEPVSSVARPPGSKMSGRNWALVAVVIATLPRHGACEKLSGRIPRNVHVEDAVVEVQLEKQRRWARGLPTEGAAPPGHGENTKPLPSNTSWCMHPCTNTAFRHCPVPAELGGFARKGGLFAEPLSSREIEVRVPKNKPHIKRVSFSVRSPPLSPHGLFSVSSQVRTATSGGCRYYQIPSVPLRTRQPCTVGCD